MTETKKTAIARNPVISRVSELDICSVRLEGRAQSASVLEALISGASQDVSIQYIASYNVVFPLYVVVRGPAKHCVLYDMKRICSAYEAKFSQPEKLT